MKILIVAFALALLGCGEAVKAENAAPANPVMAEEDVPLKDRSDKDPSLGSCSLPNKIEGGKLFTTEGGIVSLPLVQLSYSPMQIFTVTTGPAHLTCNRMSDDLAQKEDVLAIYACASMLSLFTNLQYYRVPKEYPKPKPTGPQFAA